MNERDDGVRIHADQVFSFTGGLARLADVYLPPVSGDLLPAVVWLHGGGWRFGDRHLAPDLASYAGRMGAAVVSIDYRLSDEAKFPAAIEDVKTAVRWIRSVSPNFGIDEARIGLWGSSAGAHLAACAALSCENQFLTNEHPGFSSAVQAVVDGYGPTNLARIDQDRSLVRSTGTDAESVVVGGVLPAGDPDSFESRFIGAALNDVPETVRCADPAHYVQSGAPPFLILHGEADTLIPYSHSQYLFEALSAAGNDVTLALFQNLKHGFFNDPALADRNYGNVTVLRHSGARGGDRAVWSCNSSESIPSMVCGFFRNHLAG